MAYRSSVGWSVRRKILIGAVLAIIAIAIGLGVGLGLTIGRNGGGNDNGGDNDGDDNGSQNGPPLPAANDSHLPWKPQVNDTWQIVLINNIQLNESATSVTPNVTVWDVDMFDTPKSTVQTLKGLGKRVLCYFSGGSYEPGRPDSGEFLASDQGDGLEGWPGEKWLNLSSANVRRIMKERVEYAYDMGCDGVDVDNVDGYQNKNGLGLTPQDSISFLSYLSNITLPLNLTLGLKNAGDIIQQVLPVVHFSVNEQCVKESECDVFSAFVNASKPVFHIEYPDGAGSPLKLDIVRSNCDNTGDAAGSEGFSTVLKNMDLDGWVEYCDGTVVTTPVNNTYPDN